jgi:hypothetical protein
VATNGSQTKKIHRHAPVAKATNGTNQKRRNISMGSWNKGLTKFTDERVRLNAEHISVASKGQKKTLEARQHMSIAKKGKPSWRKGKKFGSINVETKLKMSESQKKRYVEHPITEETHRKLSECATAKKVLFKGKHFSQNTEFKKGGFSPFTGHNWGTLCKKCGKVHGSNPMQGKKRPDLAGRNKLPTTIERLRLKNLGKKRTLESCKNISEAKRGKPSPKSVRDGYYGNHNWIAKREPNKSEQKITSWINEANLPFKFTGNFINSSLGISPDWTHSSEEKIFIEYDCSFWHPQNKESDLKRNRIYTENNCLVLILTERDLDNKEQTLTKIRRFCE